MSSVSEAWVVKHSPYRGSTYAVHKAIAEVVNKEREWLFYGRLVEFARKTRIDRKTIAAAIARMVADGYLRVVRSPLKPGELTAAGRPVGTGRQGIYEFVFVKGAPVVYDAEGTSFADDEADDGGEEISPPPAGAGPNRESHPGSSAGRGRAHHPETATDDEGEVISPPQSEGAEITSPGEEISAAGGEIAARNSIELEEELNTPPNPHDVGAQGRRVDGTNPRALHDAPRDRGTNPRARSVDWFLEGARGDDDDPVAVVEHLERIHTALGRGLEQHTEGARP